MLQGVWEAPCGSESDTGVSDVDQKRRRGKHDKKKNSASDVGKYGLQFAASTARFFGHDKEGSEVHPRILAMNWRSKVCFCLRSHFGSSRFLFERPHSSVCIPARSQCTPPYLVLWCQLILQISVLLTVPLPILTDWAPVPAHWKLKSMKSSCGLQLPLPAQSVSKFDRSHSDDYRRCGRTCDQRRRDWAKYQHIYLNISARIVALEGGNSSGSGVSGSPAGPWPLPGRVGGSTATKFRDPDSVDDTRNMWRKLETNADDENSRSAILLRCPSAQSRASVSAWLSNEVAESEKDSEVKCKSRRQPSSKTLTPSGRLKNVLSGRQLALVQEETLVVFYKRMPRQTVRQCGKKLETQADLAWSKHPFQCWKWRNILTWKAQTV